jgi:hypothetical protein
MGQFSHIARCSDLTRSDILASLSSPDRTYELCARLSYVSRAGETSEALLRVFSLLWSGSAEWLRGELRVTLDASGAHSIVTAFERTDDGRFVELFPPLRFALSLTELRLAIESNPRLLGGMELWEAPRGVELGMGSNSRHSVVPRSRAAASGVRPATLSPSAHERPTSPPGPARHQTKKVQIPVEALQKLKES